MEAAENSSAEQQLKTVIPAVIGSLSALVLMSIVFEHGKEKLVHFAKKRRLERIVTVLFGELTLLGFIGLVTYTVQRGDLLSHLSELEFGADDSGFLPELVESLHRAAAAHRHLERTHGYLEYVALRSRFVWRRGLRRSQEFRISAPSGNSGGPSQQQSMNASPELLEALADIRAGRLYASTRETESFLFDSHGQLQQRLRGFDFALYLSNRTERIVSDLVELPWQVWLCMLLLCSIALVVIQLASEHAPLVLVAVGFAFPLLLLALLARLSWIQEQLLNPTLLRRAQVKAVERIDSVLTGDGSSELPIGVEAELQSLSASECADELERYISAILLAQRRAGSRRTSLLRPPSLYGAALSAQVMAHRVGRHFMSHECNKPAYLLAEVSDFTHRHAKLSSHLHFKHRQRAAATKLHKQLSLFPFGSSGPKAMMVALRISVFGTAVYLGVFGIVMSSITVELYGAWSAGVFVLACAPVVCSAFLAARVLPLFVLCTSVEHLKSPREVEHVVRATKIRQALRALRLLLAFLYQAQATQSILKLEAGAENALDKLSVPSLEKYRPGLVSNRSRTSSSAQDLKSPLLGGTGVRTASAKRKVTKRGGAHIMDSSSDSSDSESSNGEASPYGAEETGLFHVHTDAQLDAAFELRNAKVAQLQADQIAEGIRRRARPVRRVPSATFTLKSTDNVRAITGRLDSSLVLALSDPNCSTPELQELKAGAACVSAAGDTGIAVSINDAAQRAVGSTAAVICANDEFAPRRRRRPLVHLRARVELRRHGADFHVPRHIGVAATEARERQDIYEAFGLLDFSTTGSLSAEDVARCLSALGVKWGCKPAHQQAIEVAIRYIDMQHSPAPAGRRCLQFGAFLAWAKQVESNTACKLTLAQLLMRELGDGAQDERLHGRELDSSELSATSFRRVLHALNMALSLDDIRVLFRDANPSGRPDVLSFEGLQALLEKHL